MTEDSPAVAEARRKAGNARAKLLGTVDEAIAYAENLQQKLQPSHLARDAWDAAKSKGVDVAEEAVDAVRKRPVVASGAVAALALFIARAPLMDLAGKLMAPKPKKPKKAARPKVRVETKND